MLAIRSMSADSTASSRTRTSSSKRRKTSEVIEWEPVLVDSYGETRPRSVLFRRIRWQGQRDRPVACHLLDGVLPIQPIAVPGDRIRGLTQQGFQDVERVVDHP